MRRVVISFFALACLMFANVLHAEQFVNWVQGQEINVPVVSGFDKKIVFPEKVALGVSTAFKKRYRAQPVDNVVYITALREATGNIRVLAKGLDSDKTYILTVYQSSQELDKETITVVSSRRANKTGTGAMLSDGKVTKVALVQYAAQNLFAPSFAIEPVEGIKRVPHGLSGDLDWMYEGAPFHIEPLLALEGGGYTVTALKLTNKSKFEVQNIDLMAFHSRMYADSAVSQHKYVGIGKEDNFTVVYIVSEGALGSKMKIRGVM